MAWRWRCEWVGDGGVNDGGGGMNGIQDVIHLLISELGTQNLFIQPFIVQCTKQHISCIKDILDMFIMGQGDIC